MIADVQIGTPNEGGEGAYTLISQVFCGAFALDARSSPRALFP
jgi:hypothetical protein